MPNPTELPADASARSSSEAKVLRPRLTVRRIVWGSLLIALIVGIVGVRTAMDRQKPVHTLGVTEGRLAPCPDSPNCVTTAPGFGDKTMAPLTFTGTASQAFDRLESIIQSMPRTRIIKRSENYMHVEFRSFLFRFVDDVEFFIPEDQTGESLRIEFRSASRVGYSDLGANRQRMTEIQRRWDQQ